MYIQTIVLTRPDTSVDFWFLSQPTQYFRDADQFITSGDIISYTSDMSTDSLTFTRVMNFRDQAGFDALVSFYNGKYPTATADRNAYNTLHGHTFTATYTTA